MSTVAKTLGLSEREYLEIERAAPTRSEFHDGQMFAMSGASRPHNLITLNLASEIHSQLKGRPCEAYTGEMRVRIAETGSYVYPDIVALCGEPRFLDGEFDTLTNPRVVVEVLSPSTESYDRNEKFALLKRLESLREYVLVAQDRRTVERRTRQADDTWSVTIVEDPDESLTLESIGCQVPLRDIYARVTLPSDELPAQA